MSGNGVVLIHGKQYVTVAKRLSDAHKEDKLQGVKTEVLQFDPVIVVKATVNIKGVEYTGISSVNTGTATGNTEKSSPFEVAETSAVGRALAFAGFETELGIASAEEIQKVEVTKEVTQTENPQIQQQTLPEDVKVCNAHDEPKKMFKGQSKTKVDKDGNPKSYWWHSENGQMCFGDGYKE